MVQTMQGLSEIINILSIFLTLFLMEVLFVFQNLLRRNFRNILVVPHLADLGAYLINSMSY